jgi:hypothetical protein
MSREIPPGPRGVHGAQANKQGLFTTSATRDVMEIARCKEAERSSRRGVIKKCTESEYDTLTGDLLMTKLRDVYADNQDPHRVPVISTLAGLETDAPPGNPPDMAQMAAAMMKRYAFAGVSMTRVVDKTEMPGRIPPQSDLPVQIAGVTTLPIYKDDAPFGRIVRAVPNEDPRFTQGHLGTNHRHLVVQVDGRNASFGRRLQEACFNKYHGQSSSGDSKDAISKATDECLEKMTDFLAVAVLAGQVALDLNYDETLLKRADPGQRTDDGIEEAEEAGKRVNLLLDRRNVQLRTDFMCAMFAGLTPTTAKATVIDPKYLCDPDKRDFATGSDKAKLNNAQVKNSAEFFTAMMDLLRLDNMWMIGKVIRGGKAPGECDVMLL